jgi:hypothetical protein
VRLDPARGSANYSTKSVTTNASSESTESMTEHFGHADERQAPASEPCGNTDDTDTSSGNTGNTDDTDDTDTSSNSGNTDTSSSSSSSSGTRTETNRGEPVVTAMTTRATYVTARTVMTDSDFLTNELPQNGGAVTSIGDAVGSITPQTIVLDDPHPEIPEIVPAIGRIPVLAVSPVVDGGRWAAKAVVGEPVPISATVFREGHDAVAATAVVRNPAGEIHERTRMTLLALGTDRYGATVMPDAEGTWTFRVEGWSDPFATWEHDATIKIEAGVDVELMLEEGARLFERALDEGVHLNADARVLRDAVHGLRDRGRPVSTRLAAGISAQIQAVMAKAPLRDLVTASPEYRLTVQRERALFSSWYEMFPRSEGAPDHKPDAGSQGRSRAPPGGCQRSPRWGSTSFICLRSIRLAGSTGRDRTTPSPPAPTIQARPGPSDRSKADTTPSTPI